MEILLNGPLILCSRLIERVKSHRDRNETIEMEEEFRRLTLQIIGEAFLSLPPDESDRVSLRYLTLISD